MKKLKIKIPGEFNLVPVVLDSYDAEYKECIVIIEGAWKTKTRLNVPLEEIYITYG